MKITKNLTLKNELYLAFGIIVLVLIALGFGWVYSINQVHSKNQNAISKWENINFISEKENEILVWVHELNRAIMLNKEFEGELDHTKSDFGKSYYKLINSDEFDNMPPEIQDTLTDIETPLKNLHNSAFKINDTLRAKNLSSTANALKIFKNETMAASNQVQNLFAEYKMQLQNQAVKNVNQVAADVNQIRSFMIIILSTVLIFILLFVYFFTKRINTSLAKTINLADNIANGNLKVDNLKLSRNDEINKLASSLNKMKNNIKTMILNINNIAGDLSASSEELSSSGQEVAVAAEQVGKSIEHVASGAEEQSAQVQEANIKINELSVEINDVQNKSDKMDAQANEAMDNIAEGNENIDQSIEKIKSVKDDSGEISKTINDLGELSNQIGEIVKLINNIAEQTNLLALNAAIEAARAGEAGRGFSVVADEIRELAEESASATDQISNLIMKIQGSVSNAVKKMNHTEEVVDDSVRVIGNTGKSFRKIESATLKLKELIEEIAQKTDKVSQNSNQVELTIKEIASVSDEAANNSEDVAAASEEQIVSTEEIVKKADELARMSSNLKKAVNQFSL